TLIVVAARHQILQSLRSAAIGNMCDVHPYGGVEQRAGKVWRRTGTTRAEVQLFLVLPRMGDELGKIADRQILARYQHGRRFGNESDRRKVGRRIVKWAPVE